MKKNKYAKCHEMQAKIAKILAEVGAIELKPPTKKAAQPVAPVVLVDADTGVTKLG